jgi:hypothetical protein
MSIITADMLTQNPKPDEVVRLPNPFGYQGGGLYVCGVPKTEDGRFYCPYCDFVSADIEQFATGMCWDCVFQEERDETYGI